MEFIFITKSSKDRNFRQSKLMNYNIRGYDRYANFTLTKFTALYFIIVV